MGQGGKITAEYFDASAQSVGTAVLWRNPVLFSGTTQVQDTFIANAGSATMKISLVANLSAGHLAFDTLSLKEFTAVNITERSTYSLAGQAIAVRVKSVTTNNPETDDLYFLYSDHLGSTSLLTDAAGNVEAGSEAHYLPFGGYRGPQPSQNITDLASQVRKRQFY